MKSSNLESSWSSCPGASTHKLTQRAYAQGGTAMQDLNLNQTVTNRSSIIVVRNQAIETRYPGGMTAFGEKHHAITTTMATVITSLDQNTIDEVVKEIEASHLSRGYDFEVVESVEPQLTEAGGNPQRLEFQIPWPLSLFGTGRTITIPPRMNRRQAIRARCLDCSAFSPKAVRACSMSDCPLHPFRMGVGRQNARERTTAIRAYCLECCAGQLTEVRKCPSHTCSLYPYRQSKADRSAEIVVTIKEPARIRFQDIPVNAELAALVESPTLIPRIALKEAFRQQCISADWFAEGGVR